MKSRSIVLVTVTGPAGREDVALAADVATFQLMDAIVALVGGRLPSGASTSARPYLKAGDRNLPPTNTLLSSGVVDGDILQLHVEGRPA